MLLQRTAADINVLPALPQQRPRGSLKGVRVRGGGRVNTTWEECRLLMLCGGLAKEKAISTDRSLRRRARIHHQAMHGRGAWLKSK